MPGSSDGLDRPDEDERDRRQINHGSADHKRASAVLFRDWDWGEGYAYSQAARRSK